MGVPIQLGWQTRIDRLANLAINVGVNLQPGQELVLTAPLQALPLVERVTEHAYRVGSRHVTTIFNDEVGTLARFRYAPISAFDYSPAWLFEGMATAFRAGAARLAISGEDPVLLAGQDPEKVFRANRARSVAYRPALDLITDFSMNWSIVSCATPAWAAQVFPNMPKEAAVSELWEAIFSASRIDNQDPIAAWAEHNLALRARTKQLNAKAYQALHFQGPGTNLEIGLSDGHQWLGGAETAKNGVVCNPNIPTEEVFTTPHCTRTNGHVRSTKPLSYQGTLITDIIVEFKEGQIVNADARTGREVLQKVLNTDEGARRLGEVALVPGSSPISRSGLLFYNTLFDENAASHIAIGQAYRSALQGGANASAEELAGRGANTSQIHIDWMIGSSKVDVDGVHASGMIDPVMRNGEWA